MAKKTHKKTTTRKKKNTTSWKSLVAFLIVMLIVGFVKTFADENSAPAPQPQVEGLEKVIIPEGTSNEIVNTSPTALSMNSPLAKLKPLANASTIFNKTLQLKDVPLSTTTNIVVTTVDTSFLQAT